MSEVDAPVPEAVDARSSSQQLDIGPFTRLAVAAMAGLILSHVGLTAWAWATACLPFVAGMVAGFMLRREYLVRAAGLLAIVPIFAGWGAVWRQLPLNSIAPYIGETSQLARVEGVVLDQPRLSVPTRGAFAPFARWDSPRTVFTLSVDRVRVDDRWRTVRGDVIVRVARADPSLRAGMRLGITGWIAQLPAPANPGERDARKLMRDRGVEGRLSVDGPANYTVRASPMLAGAWTSMRGEVAGAWRDSLRLGMWSLGPDRRAMLDALLLGQWSVDLSDLQTAFQRTGLIHLLSISGAHLGILLGLVWLIARLAAPHPRWAGLVVMLVLLGYLMALPMQTAIVRSALMAGVFCLAVVTGRRTRGIELLSLAALLLLIARPAGLDSPGFQLSFGVTAGLLLFTRRLSRRIHPDPITTGQRSSRQLLARRAADLLAVNLIGFVVALPLTAYHFGVISAAAIVMSLVMLPVATLVIALGFLKIVAGLAFPSVGLALAPPLEGSADLMAGLVERGASVPGAAVTLVQGVPVTWALACAAVGLAILSGRFARRPVFMAVSVVVLAGWLWGTQRPMESPAVAGEFPVAPALRLNMLAVGDGSCYVIRVPTPTSDYTLMFDCGSSGTLDIAQSSILPAVRRLGVKHLDLLVLSHVDLDHICGSLDLADALPVKRVMVNPQFVEHAKSGPGSPAAFFLAGLESRSIPLTVAAKGWNDRVGDARLELLWPAGDRTFARTNDSSMVLSVTFHDRRVLLNGDIQREAVPALADSSIDLRADVTDLPHHGSFVPASPRWLARVNPSIVLQSSGPRRLLVDEWADTLKERNLTRLITDRLGMVEVDIAADGKMTWWAYGRKRGSF